MAIDPNSGKRIRLVKDTHKAKEEEKKKKALPKFDVTYEEELIKSLFEEDIKKKTEILETVDDVEENSKSHHSRPGEL